VDWDGRDRDGSPLPSGVYTFRLVADQGRAATVSGVLVR
jgi:flagellar hook assembly protein FlgD